MSPLASRDPIFFARLEAGRPILIPGEGFSSSTWSTSPMWPR